MDHVSFGVSGLRVTRDGWETNQAHFGHWALKHSLDPLAPDGRLMERAGSRCSACIFTALAYSMGSVKAWGSKTLTSLVDQGKIDARRCYGTS